MINLHTPGVKLAPWHKTASIPQDELITTIGEDPMEAVKYLYRFRAGQNRGGAQYLRIHIAFPTCYHVDEIVKKNKNSIMILGKQSLLKANSQCISPTTIGWLLRSTPTMMDLWNVKGGFGLYWATVKDGKPYDPKATTRAIHIEVEEQEAPEVKRWAEKTYGRASQNITDYPLGINMMFVQPYNEVRGSAKALVAKLATYQHTNDKMTLSASWYGGFALEKSIQKDKYESLRFWLMSMKSKVSKTANNGTPYHDRLFTGIHRSSDTLETRFYFYKVNEVEANNVITALPLVIKEELQLDPSCFFHRSDYQMLLEGTWDKDRREYKNPHMLNQEQYLQDMDEFFTANRAFFPDMVTVGQLPVDDLQGKAMAMAQGEDDVSIVSNLTEKRLRAATSVHGEDTSSVQSGNTSRSKTKLAVTVALKEVTIEHSKAMAEQQTRLQREIDKLQTQLEQQNSIGHAVLRHSEISQDSTSPDTLLVEYGNVETTEEFQQTCV